MVLRSYLNRIYCRRFRGSRSRDWSQEDNALAPKWLENQRYCKLSVGPQHTHRSLTRAGLPDTWSRPERAKGARRSTRLKTWDVCASLLNIIPENCYNFRGGSVFDLGRASHFKNYRGEAREHSLGLDMALSL